MRKTWLFGIVFLFCIMSVMATPVVTLLNQTPTDITTTNIKNTPLIIFANVTTVSNIDNATVKIYFKSNNSLDDNSFLVNGTAYTGWNNTRLFDSFYGDKLYKFIGYENAVYSGNYNFQWLSFRYGTHIATPLTTSNDWLKVQFFNVSTTKTENYVAYMINNTVGTDFAKVYYCNESYTAGAVTTSPFCVFIYNTPSNDWNHCHPGNNSCHFVAPLPIASGKVGTIDVTSTSYFLFQGRSGSTVQYWYITNSSRNNAIMTSSNNGVGWTNRLWTADVNLKQFDGTDRVTYKVCASNTTGSQGCSDEISQLLIPGDVVSLPTEPTTYSESFRTAVCPTDTLQNTILFCFIGLLFVALFIYSDQKGFGIGLIIVSVGLIFMSLSLFGCSLAYGLLVLSLGLICGMYALKWKYY